MSTNWSDTLAKTANFSPISATQRNGQKDLRGLLVKLLPSLQKYKDHKGQICAQQFGIVLKGK